MGKFLYRNIIYKMQENYYETFLQKTENKLPGRDNEYIDWITQFMSKIVRDAKLWEPEKTYKYMLTFTLDPNKVDLKDTEKKDKIEKYIENLIRRPEATKAYYVREHNETNTHWHVVVHRSSALKSDYLTYYKKNFGNVHTSRSKSLDDNHSIKYLSKENEIIIII